jgi:hypothetical protein
MAFCAGSFSNWQSLPARSIDKTGLRDCCGVPLEWAELLRIESWIMERRVTDLLQRWIPASASKMEAGPKEARD